MGPGSNATVNNRASGRMWTSKVNIGAPGQAARCRRFPRRRQAIRLLLPFHDCIRLIACSFCSVSSSLRTAHGLYLFSQLIVITITPRTAAYSKSTLLSSFRLCSSWRMPPLRQARRALRAINASRTRRCRIKERRPRRARPHPSCMSTAVPCAAPRRVRPKAPIRMPRTRRRGVPISGSLSSTRRCVATCRYSMGLADLDRHSQTGTSFFACPATGEVSWDAPVGNFV